ncbi:MAG TPA: FAD-dependent oxidoreductase [Candidatus Dormibacteraeota bacterium]|nr:FAD-dependent oxidoreductase [Candidatus Dormibacteraeota bacterium]
MGEIDLGLRDHALTPGAQRSWWLREALAREGEAEPCPPLAGDSAADVVIVGGGFTGLWTAYQLARRNPQLGITILEQDICGGGPSGRNGGFASGWWDEIESLTAQFGRDDAVRTCKALGASIDALGEFCREHGVDAWYRKAGYMFAATGPRHEHGLDEMAQAAAESGHPEEMRLLSREEVQARCASPIFRRGAFMPDGAQVQPAFLARGLRRVVLGLGVKIHENTVVRRLDGGPAAVTDSGTVRAKHAVLAVNAWATGWPQLARRIAAWSSYIVLTEPAPEKLEEIHWTGGELITDLRHSVRYFRTTPDGRIAFGGGGGRASAHLGDSFTKDARAVRESAEGFRRFFPSWKDVAIVDAWGGPIDVSSTHLPTFGTLEGNVHFAVGYTGNGVAPSHLAGIVLADLVQGADTDAVHLPIVNARTRNFPPEPFRSLGAAMVRRAIISFDTAEEKGEHPNPLASFVAHMPRRMGYLLGP